MLEILEFLNALFWLATKFIMGLGFVLYQDFSLVESVAIAVGGGMLGVVIFALSLIHIFRAHGTDS